MIQQLSIAPTLAAPKRPSLRFFGGKWRLAKWIISLINDIHPRHSSYIEPFGGGYCVGLQKFPVDLEVYNDINDDSVNFFQTLRDHPRELIEAISKTGRTHSTFANCKKRSVDPIEQAKNYYIYSRLSFSGGGTRWNSGTSMERLALPSVHDDTMLWPTSQRISHLIIEQHDAIACIKKWDHPTHLFYVDPPYLMSARRGKDKRQYQYELLEAAHVELVDALTSTRAGVVVSGYPSPLYEQLFEGWGKRERQVSTLVRDQALECLWWKSPSAGVNRDRSLPGAVSTGAGL